MNDQFNLFDEEEDDDQPIHPQPNWSLKRCLDWLAKNKDDGVRCPLCKQFAKIYRRKLNRTMVKALVQVYRAGGSRNFVHAPTVLAHDARAARDMGKLANHGLVEEQPVRREDGGRAGYWQITDLGMAFMRGRSLPKYAVIYAGRVLGHVGPEVTISDVAPEFRLDELMKGI